MTEDIYWKNFEGIAKASYSFRDETLVNHLITQEERGVNVVGLHIDFASKTIELIVEAPPEEAKSVMQYGVKIDEDDDFEIFNLVEKK